MSVEEARTRIVHGLKNAQDRCEVKSFPGFICLRIHEEDRHFWSPRLVISLEEAEDGTTNVEGVYGPNANVWALFFYGYLITGTLALICGSLGFVQMTLDYKPWGIWVTTAMLAAAGGLYILAQFGQKLGASQTFRLHQIYESAIGSAAEIH